MTATALTNTPADLIIRNAHIVTVDQHFSIAARCGDPRRQIHRRRQRAAVLKPQGPKTRVIDLHGQTVLPGFNDTHVHLTRGQGSGDPGRPHEHPFDQGDPGGDRGAGEARRSQANGSSGTRGWWEYQLAEGRLPTRADLDAAAPNNPVSIPGPHYVIVNSLALQLAGVTRDTPDPQGGQVYKDANGEPTGLLMDNAGRFVRKFMPQGEPAQQERG